MCHLGTPKSKTKCKELGGIFTRPYFLGSAENIVDCLPEDLPMLVGVLCGAVTNTPGLGAANEALSQMGSYSKIVQIEDRTK